MTDEGPGFYLIIDGRIVAHAFEAVDGPAAPNLKEQFFNSVR